MAKLPPKWELSFLEHLTLTVGSELCLKIPSQMTHVVSVIVLTRNTINTFFKGRERATLYPLQLTMHGNGPVPHSQEFSPIWKEGCRMKASVEMDVCFVPERFIWGSHLEFATIRYQNIMSMDFYGSRASQQELAT